MTNEEKQKLVDAVNCKFPQNNLTELYYNIGRVLPFTAQRFPDGRVSGWYRNQYVQVVRVEPHGKFGKYKGQTILSIYTNYPQYLKWLTEQNPDFMIDWDDLKSR